MPIGDPLTTFAHSLGEWGPIGGETGARTVDKFTQITLSLFACAKPVSAVANRALFAGIVIVAFVLAVPAVSTGQERLSGNQSHGRSLPQSGSRPNVTAAVSLLSRYRHSHGLPGVRIDSTLMKLAKQQTAAMVTNDQLSHDVDGDFSTRLRRAGYRSRAAAENISAGYFTVGDAFSSWRDSPSHRANMLLEGATRIGIAAMYAPNSRYKMYWALILAEPAAGRRRK